MVSLHVALLLFVAVFAVVVSAVYKPSTTTSAAPATAPTNVAKAPGGNGKAIGTNDNDAAATPGEDNVASMGSDSSNANYPPPQQASGNEATVRVGFAYYLAAAMVGSFFFL